MIIRGGGAIGAPDFAGAASCICVTLLCAGGCVAGLVARGGTEMTGGAVVALVAAGAVAAGGARGPLGGIPTTVGGRYPAATEAGVTILGVGGAGAPAAGLGGIGLSAPALPFTA